METSQVSNRIHPLMAGAAASVMLVSMVGVAAITGILPNSHGNSAPLAPVAVAPAPVDARMAMTPATAAQYAPAAAVATAPVVIHKHIVEHKPAPKRAAPVYAQRAPSPQYTQVSQPAQQPAQQPVQQASAPTSGLGIAAGAVLGGVLGNQVGDGRGRTLATVAGAVGGGYLGNVVERKMRD
ncbi:MAG: hypothetical protein V7606_1878 [Burkholderiales bacterium]|jgi:uncharacterized protein YcfJ